MTYSFKGYDGGFPVASLTIDASGNFYGTTNSGGAYRGGTIFTLIRTQNSGWKETVLHSFSGGNGDGKEPLAGVTFDASGNLYTTTNHGGTTTKELFLNSLASNGKLTAHFSRRLRKAVDPSR